MIGRRPVLPNVARVAAAVAPPLVAGIAFALWQISDGLLYVGSIDRGTFAAFVVIPLWVIAPAVALAWRDLDTGVLDRLSAGSGLVIGAGIAAFLWSSAISVDCKPSHTPMELVLPALIVGAVVGGGFGLACRVAAGQFAGGHPWRAIGIAAALQLEMLAVGLFLQFWLFFGLCQRP
jgi:hypothetical protein